MVAIPDIRHCWNYYHAVAYFMLKMGTYFDDSTLATANCAGGGEVRFEIIFYLRLEHASYLPKHKEERSLSRRVACVKTAGIIG